MLIAYGDVSLGDGLFGVLHAGGQAVRASDLEVLRGHERVAVPQR